MKDAFFGFRLLELAADGGALLVHLAFKATLLLLVALVVVGVLRRSSAALRHTLWSVCCLGLLLLPAFTIALPAWQPAVMKSVGSLLGKSTAAAPPTPLQLAPSQGTTSFTLQSTVTDPNDFAHAVSTEQWILATLFVCWSLGAVVVAGKLAVGFVAAKRLQRRGRLVDEGPLWQEFMECASSLDVPVSPFMAPPRLMRVDDEALPIPLTWGWRRPVVLMPQTSMQWPASCRRAALLHEISHIRRLDWLIQSLASLTCLFYWFHPLAWFASRRLRLESECATDDHVLATGLKATDYSSSLLEIVRFVGSHRENSAHLQDSLMKFAVPLSGTSKIEMRLRSILDPKQSRSAVNKKLLAAISLVAFATIVPLAAAKEPAEGDQPDKAAETPLPIYNWKRGVSTVGPNGEETILVLPVGMEDGHVVLTASKKTVVTGFQFSGNKALPTTELQKRLVSKTGVLLNVSNIMGDAVALHRAYTSKGIRLHIKGVAQNEAGVITYELQENPALAGSKSEGEARIAVGEPGRTVITPSFIHRRGYANYINGSGGQPPSQPTYVREAFVSSSMNGDAEQPSISRMALLAKGPHQSLEWATVTGFKFTGNKALKADELQKLLVSKTGAPLDDRNVKADAAAIRKAYADKGLSVQVRSAALDTSGMVSYDLLETHVITGFKFSGNTLLKDDELQKTLVSKTGVLLNQRNVAEDVMALQKVYSDKGFAVLVSNASQDDAGVMSYNLLEAKLTQIKLSGLTKTAPQMIRKLITASINAPFDASQLRRDLSRLYDTQLFEDVTFKMDDDPTAKGGVIATFMLKEKGTTP